MANTNLTIPIALRGGSTPVVTNLPFGTNAWQHIQLQINSSDWNTINGLTLGYSARVTVNGGLSFVSWGGLTAVSPTFLKDGVTKVEPGGIWDWNSAFHDGGSIEVTVACPTAFHWGATVSLLDT